MDKIIVQNNVLVNILRQHLKGRVRSSINFTCDEDFVRVQSSNDFVLDTLMPCTYRGNKPESFSVLITGAVDLLRSDDGSTEITRLGDVVMFDQGDISIPFDISYDERIEVSFDSLKQAGRIGGGDVQAITRGFRNLTNISKSLEVGYPPIVVSSGYVYCIYSNIIFIGGVPMSLPDFEIPYNTFSNFSKNLSGSTINVFYDDNSKVIVFQVGSTSSATSTYKKPNLEMISAIQNRMAELSPIGTFDVSVITKLELLYKCFPKESVTLSFYVDNTLGIMFNVTDGKSVRAGTKDLETVCNIAISTAQFDGLYKTFNGTSRVEVLKGRDILCLKGVGNKTLIVSGMTF